MGTIYNVAAPNFKKVTNRNNISLLDIRTPKEFQSGHIKGAINIDWYKRTFKEKVEKLPKNKPIVIYCRSGNRTSKAAYLLQSLGFKDIVNLSLGINDWNRHGYVLEK